MGIPLATALIAVAITASVELVLVVSLLSCGAHNGLLP